MIEENAGYLAMVAMIVVANARYLLMSCALSQKISPKTGLLHRMLVGFEVTDEVFGIEIAVPGMLNPWYTYGAMSMAVPGWALGTCLGVIMGNILPTSSLTKLRMLLTISQERGVANASSSVAASNFIR